MLVSIQRRCDGSALIIALLILIVMTVIGVSTVTTSTQEMIMAGNTQDASASFQSSEAGVTGMMSLATTANNPFDGEDHETIQSDGQLGGLYDSDDGTKLSTHPLEKIPDVNVNTIAVQTNITCPRKTAGSSVDLITCDNYQVESEHASAVTGAYTKIGQGVQKELLAK